MFIAAATPEDRAPAERDVSAATFGSSGAVINFRGQGYKHLVPPGPGNIDQHTITPLSATLKLRTVRFSVQFL
jgi:hypothetical protein